MYDNPRRAPRLSYDAWSLMQLLQHRGGGMRIRPLLQASTLSDDALVAAVNELVERLWVEIVWRSPEARRPELLPERFREARRIATTRTGRHCHRFVPKF
jgi:hypothetical protein